MSDTTTTWMPSGADLRCGRGSSGEVEKQVEEFAARAAASSFRIGLARRPGEGGGSYAQRFRGELFWRFQELAGLLAECDHLLNLIQNANSDASGGWS